MSGRATGHTEDRGPLNPVSFGVFVVPRATDVGLLRENVHAAEGYGFDYVSIQDHPYNPAFLDTFALIGSLVAETARIGFMTNVANLPLRPPAVLAKTAASLDLLSGGRFELGLGAGGSGAQITAVGGAALTPGQASRAIEEAIGMLRTLWKAGDTADFTGEHYFLAAAPTGPAPAHRVGILLGAKGPRLLDLLGRTADGWIAPVTTPFESKPAAQDRIDAAAAVAGRRPTDIRRVVQLVGTVTDRRGSTARPRGGPGTRPVRATPEDWAAIVAGFVNEERFDTVNFIPEAENEEQIRRFATEVVPAVRAALADRRTAGE
jgi:alkanesulfonate monooxygenase SsuD/methylene tetrahydromethanopterin reductase-like flavin-dependent oxidoreductase (luciferase family)